jgi:threonine dehydrogenase-like Zn-dependent dehydrogenase
VDQLDFPLGDAVRSMTDGRGTDAAIDAVGMEAHGSPVAKPAQAVTGVLPDAMAKQMMQTAGVDRLDALYSAIDVVRRGGTISLSVCMAGWPIRCPCRRCSTSRFSCGWGRQT